MALQKVDQASSLQDAIVGFIPLVVFLIKSTIKT